MNATDRAVAWKITFVTLVLAVTASAVFASDPSTPVQKPSPEWQQKHAANVATAKAGGIELLFLGDSITEYWNAEGKDVWAKTFAPIKAANFGIAADKVENVLWRVQNGEFDGIQPRTVVLLCGINNTLALKRDERETGGKAIASGIGEIVKTIRAKSPQSKIIILAIFPTADGADLTVNTANSALAKMDDGRTVRFLDLGSKLADSAGKFGQGEHKRRLAFVCQRLPDMGKCDTSSLTRNECNGARAAREEVSSVT